MSEHLMTTAGPVIRTQGLTRHFTRHKTTVEAVRGLDLEIGDGELVAFLGPNGAGKSTTLRMLTTLIPPTAGTAEVAGYDVVRHRREVRRSIGYVGQGNAAGHAQRGRDELISQARSHGMTRVGARQRAEELLDVFDLAEHAHRPVSTLSGGQRRRLDVAIGLVHSPRLLFLDEPSTGLDPQNRVNLAEQIERLHAQNGTTIVLTTHYLEEADALAGRVIVIDHGLVIADDTASRLKSALGDRVSLTFGSDRDAAAGAERASRIDGAGVVVSGTELTVRVAHGRDLAADLVTDLAAAGAPVRRLAVVGPTLDDVFLDLTGRSLRESENGSRNGSQHGSRSEHDDHATEGAAA
jgi:ABC-2 type transport system ATP-binding protein